MNELANLNDFEKNLVLQRTAQKGNQLNFYKKSFNANHPQKKLGIYATSTYGNVPANGGYGLTLRRALNSSRPFNQYQVTNSANRNTLTNNVTTLNGELLYGYSYNQLGNNGTTNIYV